MSNKTKQLIIASVGLLLAVGGALIRLLIRDPWFQEPLCLLISMGRTKYSSQAPYNDAVDAVSSMAMAIFFTGLALLVTAVAAWLFLSQKQQTEE